MCACQKLQFAETTDQSLEKVVSDRRKSITSAQARELKRATKHSSFLLAQSKKKKQLASKPVAILSSKKSPREFIRKRSALSKKKDKYSDFKPSDDFSNYEDSSDNGEDLVSTIEHEPVDMFGSLSTDDEFDSFLVAPPSPKKEKSLADKAKIEHINSTQLGVIEKRRQNRIAKKKEKRRVRQLIRASAAKPKREEFTEPSAYFIDLNAKKLEKSLKPDDVKQKKTRGGVRRGHPNKNRRILKRNEKQEKYNHAIARAKHSASVKAAAKERRKLAKEKKKKDSIVTESGIAPLPEVDIFGDTARFFETDPYESDWKHGGFEEFTFDRIETETVLGTADKLFQTFNDVKTSLFAHFDENQRHTLKQVVSVLALAEACRGSAISKKVAAITLFLGNDTAYNTKAISAGLFAFSILYDKWNEDEIKTESLSETIEDFTAVVNDVWNSELVTALRNVLVLLGTAKLFSKEVGLGIIAALGAIPSMKLDELFVYVSKIFTAIFKFFENLRNGVPFSKAMMAEDPIKECKLTMARLIRESNNLYTSLPIDGYVSHKVWSKEANAIIKLVEGILPKLRKSDANYVVIDRLFRELGKVYNLKVLVAQAKSRSAPYGIIIYGDPGIGKSGILNLLCATHSEVMGTDYNPADTYHRVPTSEYWEGYEDQARIHYSEVGNSTEAVLAQGDVAVAEFCSLIDRLPFPLNMADVTLKGKVYANPSLVVIDTNSPGMNLKYLVKNPAAVQRRFIYVLPVVKPEFRKEGTTAIDPEKSMLAGGVLLDRYEFQVTIKKPSGLLNTIDETVYLKDIYELMDFVSTDMVRHIRVEEALSDPQQLCQDALEMHKKRKLCGSIDEFLDDEKLLSESGVLASFKVMSYLTMGLYKDDVSAISSNFFYMILSIISLAGLTYLDKITSYSQFFDRLFTMMVLCLSYFVSTTLLAFVITSTFLVWFVLPNLMAMCNKLIKEEIDLYKNDIYVRYNSIKYYGGFDTQFTPIFSDRYYWPSSKAMISTFTLIASGGAIAALYKYFTKINNKTESSFQIPSDFNEKLENLEKSIHCGKSYERIPNSLDPSIWNIKFPDPKTIHTDSASSLFTSIASNIRKVTMKLPDGKVKHTHILGVQGNFAILNTHFLGPDWEGKTISLHNTDSIKSSITFDTFLDSRNVRHLGGDISVVMFSSVRFRDIVKHLNTVTETYPRVFSADILGDDTVASFVPTITATDTFSGEITLDGTYKYSCYSHYEGMCGVPLIASYAKGASIMGIHFAGSAGSGDCYAAILHQHSVIEAIDDITSSVPYLPAPSSVPVSTESLLDPVRKSAFRFEPLPGVQYFGKLPGNILMNKKSAIVKTAIHDRVPEFLTKHLGYVPTVKYGPPQMKPKIVDGVYVSPYNMCLKAMSHKRPALKLDVMEKTVDCITKHLIEELENKGVTELQPIDIESAINGVEHDCFLRRINANTSGGFGFPGKKDTYIPIYSVDEKDETIYREPTEDLKERVFTILNDYVDGIGHNIYYKGHLKEEARPLGKKTRMFYIAPLDDLVVSRMVLFPIFSLMIEHCKIFCTAIGVNTHVDADGMARDILDFSDKSFVGDYKYWDIHNLADVGAAANKIIHSVSKHFGMNDKALKVLDGYLGDELYPIIEMLLDVFMVPGMVTSGKYGTAEMNSLRNLVNAVYIWYDTPALQNKDFFKFCLPITYGDDIMVTVKDEVIDHYNGTTFQVALREKFNMTFTAPDKSPIVAKYVEFNELDFLKRRFVYREDLQRYVLILSEESLYKTLSWTLPSRSISTIEQLLSSSGSVLREMYFYLEADKYEDARNDLIDMIIEAFPMADRSVISDSYPRFDEISNQLFGIGLSDSIFLEEKDELRPITENGMRVHAYGSSALIGCTTPPKHLKPERVYCVENLQLAEMKREVSVASIKEKHLEGKNVSDMEVIYRETLRDVADLKASSLITGDLESYRSRKQWFTDSRTRRELKQKMPVLALEANVAATMIVIDRLKRKSIIHDEIKTESGVDGEVSDGVISSSVMNTVENFIEVGGTESKEIDLGYSNLSEVYAMAPSLGMVPDRPVELFTAQIAVGTSLSAQIDVYDLISLNPVVRSKFRNFGYAKMNSKVRISVSGTPFHSGQLIVAYIPYADRVDGLQALISRFAFDATSRPCLLAYLSQAYGAQLINVNENKPTEISIPFMSYKPVYRLFNDSTAVLAAGTSYTDFSEAGSLFIYTLNSPKSVSTTPSAVSIQVVGWFEDLELFCPTATQIEITTESGIYTESGVDERDVGPVEAFSTRASLYSVWFKKIPVIGKYAYASEMAFGAMAQVASLFGWSRPTVIEDPLVVKNNGYSNGALCIGGETNYRIVTDPKQELSINPGLFGIEEDEMVINHLTKINSYIDTFAWNDNDPVMVSPIYSCAVVPNIGVYSTGVTDTVYQPSTLDFTATPFVYWRGDIIFEFNIVCSKYHRGKLMFYYEPNLNQKVLIDANLSTNKQCLAVIDIQETQNVKFCVAWASCRDWLLTLPTSIARQNIIRSTNLTGIELNANGYIGVVPFTTLQSPDNSDIEINVFISSDNIKYNMLEGAYLPNNRNIRTESGVDASVDVTCIELNGKSTDAPYICSEYFGEAIYSFRYSGKRYTKSDEIAIAVTPSAGYITVELPIFPRVKYPYGSASTYTQEMGLYEYLRFAYLGVRGGLKKRSFFDITGSDRHTDAVKVSLQLSSLTSIPSATFATVASVYARLRGTLSLMLSSNAGVEFEVPNYMSNLFLFGCANDLVGTTFSGLSFSTYRLQSYLIQLRTSAASAAGMYYEETAFGEDFSFYRFLASPPMVIT